MRRISKPLVLLALFFLFVVPAGQCQSSDLELARRAYADGFYDVAESMLKKVIQTSFLEEIPAKLLLAKVYIAQKKYKSAMTLLLELDSAPDTPPELSLEIKETLAQLYQSIGDYDSALEKAKELITFGPEGAKRALDLLVDVLLKQGKIKEALTWVQKYRDAKDRAVRQVARFKEAKIYYQQKDYEKAKELFERFIYDFPESEYLSSAYFYLGKTHYFLGDYDTAITYFDKVALMYKDSDLGGYALQAKAWCLLRKGDLESAEKALEEAKRRLKTLTDSFEFARGYLLYKRGKYKEALAQFESLLVKYPNSSWLKEANFWIAECLFNLGNYQDALEYYQKVIGSYSLSSDPDAKEMLLSAYYGLAWSYLKLGKYDLAINAFKTIAEVAEDELEKISALVKVGETYLSKGDPAKAITVFNEIMAKYPDNYYSDYILLQMGVAYTKMEKYDSAVLYFQELLKDYPNSSYIWDAKYNLALALFNLGDFKQCVEVLNEIKQAKKDEAYQPHLDYVLATAYFNAKEFKSALHLFRRLMSRLSSEKLRPEVEYELAWCYYRLGREKEALKRFRELIDKYPDDLLAREVMLWLAEKYLSEGKYTQAQGYLERFITSYADSPQVYKARYDLAWLYAMKGDDQKAIELLSKYLNDEGNPMKAEYHIALAYLYRQQGKFEEAVTALKWVLANAPEFSRKAYEELSVVYRQMHRLADSAYALERAVDYSPESKKGELLYRIGELWESAGEMDKAVEFYLKAGYNTASPERLRAQALLKAGRIYERKSQLDKALKLYEKVAGMSVPEAKLAKEKLTIQEVGR